MKNLVFFLLIVSPLLSLTQINRYESFFSEIDSTNNPIIAIQKLQNFKVNRKLNLAEDAIYYDKMLSLAQKTQQYNLILKYAFQGLEYAKKIKHDSLISYFNLKIGVGFYYVGKKIKAEYYYKKALKIAKDKFWITEAKALNNLGAIYIENKSYVKAEKCLLKAVFLYKDRNVLLEEGLLPYRLLATLYSDIKRYEESEAIFLEIDKAAKINKDTTLICYNLVYYSNLLLKMNQLKKSIELSKIALKYQDIQKNNATIILILRSLSVFYQKDNQFKNASETFERLYVLKNKVFSEDLEKKVAENEVKYKTTQIKHQKEIAESLARSVKRKNQIYVILFSSSIFLFLILFLVFYFKQQAKKRKEELQVQKLLLESVIKAQEDEKMRIARDLHDGICQKFAATKINFSTVNIENEQEAIKFKKAVALLDESTNELRTISHEIMPPALHQNDLGSAIKLLAQNSFPSEMKFSFEVFGKMFQFSENIQINIYRITQELIANIVKHSQATEVSIQLLFSESHLTILIEDNGIGLDLNKMDGLGLKNIKIRTEIINAKLEFDKGVLNGTISTFTISKNS